MSIIEKDPFKRYLHKIGDIVQTFVAEKATLIEDIIQINGSYVFPNKVLVDFTETVSGAFHFLSLDHNIYGELIVAYYSLLEGVPTLFYSDSYENGNLQFLNAEWWDERIPQKVILNRFMQFQLTCTTKGGKYKILDFKKFIIRLRRLFEAKQLPFQT